ncbi:hypothetical protein F2P47_03920 [Parvibaculum sedimenti]|uniref:Uncharacterized protein n=1 Tax=Parvibaculum sedimenti TaxID=2608632 RepID=A0A6N6VNU2_9HYPH|nr:hypothetical protein [Parvibaculum sedimenti]KAB7741560.1 hypothetical protein F2P47_03920 [Parvibaculum sedimenti]
MATDEMTLERLAEIAGAYGASPDLWPAGERQAAQSLLARSAEARALVQEAGELDSLLAMAPAADAPSPELLSRIMAARPRAATGRILSHQARRASLWQSIARIVWPYGSAAFPAGALAASIMLGIGFGAALPSGVTAEGLSSLGLAPVQSASASTGTAGEQLVSFALAENEYPEDWKK